jgi:hypothetical protein
MDKATVALILSGVAILVSGTIAILDYRIARARRSEEVEAQGRACLSARLDPPGRPDHLVISCSGSTSARDVVVEVEPATIPFPGRAHILSDARARTGGTCVRCHHKRRLRLRHPTTRSCGPRWRDDRGPEAKDMSLTV